ncbi:cobyric acid synthase [Thalassospira povalilytica]|uniref:cobyric acid synthase n=1 Tax=Thalassospira povalilytica TaxID=732237 RepID=UPI001D17D58F|nr:cobyric acid synthase [Thalassospira povalilytica]MCC4240076.1 cobyric acid synthase [Thalassospira povalilytica]
MNAQSVPALMLQGTGSDVGKSMLVAGLCRAFARRGLRVRPFKPQNMSNNAAVTDDGGEIGRAQALQARAAGVPTKVHMNPVLLKPQSDIGAQVVVQGKVLTSAKARDYYRLKRDLLPRVIESFEIMANDADLVLVEGAGSPAEVNLRASDIANMGFAEAAGVPVILVGDIDRGGVIASIVGTHALLSDSDRKWLRGYVINKFRGDVSLFASATDIIEQTCGLKSYGIATYWPGAHKLPAEDGVALEKAGKYQRKQDGASGPVIRIAVPHLPRIANFDDLDPLAAEADVELLVIKPGQVIPADCDLVLLPGSKSTMADLRFLKEQGWDIDILAHHRRGGAVIGICGGYQMLGRMVHDPDGVEGEPGSETGLGLLDVETVMAGDKTLRKTDGLTVMSHAPSSGALFSADVAVNGYEIHMGRTDGPDRARGWLALAGIAEPDGAISTNGRVMGCYLHGLFGSDAFRQNLLASLGGKDRVALHDFEAGVDAALDELADHLEACLDLDGLLELARSRTK